MSEQAIEIPWWQKVRWRQSSRTESEFFEQQLLALGGTNLHRSLKATDVAIGSGKHEFLHTITGGDLSNIDPNNKAPLVYIPGYGAGVGFMYRAFEGLISGWKVHAVDPLGTGLSGRPPFRAKTTQEAEDFFVDSLAKWREAQGIDKMVLVGHSMGGYLSAVYALRNPSHVSHLVLVCPAGIGKRPDDWKPPESLRNPWTVRGMLYRSARAFWDWGLTPGSIIRFMGPLGPSMVEGYTRRRFKIGHHLTEEEVEAFRKYMYGVLAARGSGEHALRYILEPFAFPRQPLEDRLHELKVPLTFIYGEHDWMDQQAAVRTCQKIKAQRPMMAASDGQVLITKAAGHYPFIDQPGLFLEDLLEACGEYLTVSARERVKAVAAKRPLAVNGDVGVVADDAAELRDEMKRNPVEAETRIATDM